MNRILILIVMALPVLALAQPKDNSPYSRFGIGDIVDNNFMASRQMGSLGASFADPYVINIVNPASLSYLTTATFDVGLHAEYSSLKDRNDLTVGRWNGNLNYLSLAFPLQNKLNDLLDRKRREIKAGMAFTLMPYSTVGYDISSFFQHEEFGQYEVNYQGSGGTYQFLWSNGISYKDLAFGFNVGYLFGKISNSTSINFIDSEATFGSFLDRNSSVSGFLWDAGLMYTYKFDKGESDELESEGPRKLVFGIHGHSNTGMTSSSSVFDISVLPLPNGVAIVDTFQNSEGEKMSGTLPAQLGLGISYINGNTFGVGFNYETTNWSGFEADFVNYNLNDSYNLSFGGFYRPNYKSITSYFSRVYYRMGLHYRKIPVEVAEGEGIDDVGLSLGMGMPFFYQRKISHANLGVSLGIRGRDTAIEERYIRFTFSFTFNDDEWFIKRKYN